MDENSNKLEVLQSAVVCYRNEVLKAMNNCGYNTSSINTTTISLALRCTRSALKINRLLRALKNYWVLVDRLNGRLNKEDEQ